MPLRSLALLLVLAATACKKPPEKTDADGDGVTADLDCDDSDPAVFPGVTEQIYDGVDNDCDPSTPDDDLDGDGFPRADDCDDRDPELGPGAGETPYDGIDNDCDPSTPDDDLDGDGYGIATDCADGNADIHPGADEIYYDDIDNDCDPLLTVDDDQDRDQVPADVDCDDLDPLSRAPLTWFVDCDGDGFAAESATSTSGCSAPAAPAACPDGDWTLTEPVDDPHVAANATTDCADGDPLAWPGQTVFSIDPVVDGDPGWLHDFDCDGTEEPLYGDYTCAVFPDTAPDTFFCTHVPGFAADTACGAVGDYTSGCTVIDATTCASVSSEARTQECR